MDLTGASDAEISQSSGTDTFFSPMSSDNDKPRVSRNRNTKDDRSSVASEEVVIEMDSRYSIETLQSGECDF